MLFDFVLHFSNNGSMLKFHYERAQKCNCIQTCFNWHFESHVVWICVLLCKYFFHAQIPLRARPQMQLSWSLVQLTRWNPCCFDFVLLFCVLQTVVPCSNSTTSAPQNATVIKLVLTYTLNSMLLDFVLCFANSGSMLKFHHDCGPKWNCHQACFNSHFETHVVGLCFQLLKWCTVLKFHHERAPKRNCHQACCNSHLETHVVWLRFAFFK